VPKITVSEASKSGQKVTKSGQKVVRKWSDLVIFLARSEVQMSCGSQSRPKSVKFQKKTLNFGKFWKKSEKKVVCGSREWRNL